MTSSQMELVIDLGRHPMTDSIKNGVMALREGKIVLLLDAHDRENEGDLIVAAEKITKESMNFLIKRGSGVVCLALPKKRLDELGLPLMISDNTNFFQTAFTVSVEARTGVTTGVSASDRTHTIQVAMDDLTKSHDLARPGHVFPLAARPNGVFDRMGHTEASVDLMRLSGLKPGAVLCELMNEDGSMTTGEDRLAFAKDHAIPVISIEEILCYRMQSEDLFKKSTKNVTTRFGHLTWHSFSFFDGILVDIFHKPKWCPADHKATLLSMSVGDNMHRRFMAQMLMPSDDDQLACALLKVKEDSADLALMCTGGDTLSVKTNHERALRRHAAICRVLRELRVKGIASTDYELGRIAKSYFDIDVY